MNADDYHAHRTVEADKTFENTRNSRSILYDNLETFTSGDNSLLREGLRRSLLNTSVPSPSGVLVTSLEDDPCCFARGTRLLENNLSDETKIEKGLEGLLMTDPNHRLKALTILIELLDDLGNFESTLRTSAPWLWVTTLSEGYADSTTPADAMRRVGLPMYTDLDPTSSIPSDHFFDLVIRLDLREDITARFPLHVPSVFDAGGFPWFLPYRDHMLPRSGRTALYGSDVLDGVREWVLPAMPFSEAVKTLTPLGFVAETSPTPPFGRLTSLLEERLTRYHSRGASAE